MSSVFCGLVFIAINADYYISQRYVFWKWKQVFHAFVALKISQDILGTLGYLGYLSISQVTQDISDISGYRR